MIDLMLAALLLAGAYSLGAALLRKADRLVFDPWPRKLLFRTGLGFGALAYLMLLLGSLGLVKVWAAWLLVLGALLAGIPALLAEWRARQAMAARTADTPVDFEHQTHWPHLWPGGGWPRALSLVGGLVIGLLALGAVLNALAPPVAYDDLTYHLAAPKVFVRTGHVAVLPYDHHTAFPFTMEMLYTIGLLLHGPGVAKLIHTIFWALSLLAIHSLGSGLFGPRTGWLATLLYAATPLVWYQSGTGYTEFGFALYQLLAILALTDCLNLRAHAVTVSGDGTMTVKPRQPQWVWICGLCCGLAYGFKYTGVLTVVFVALVVFWLGRRDGLRGQAIRVDLIKLVGVAAIVASPWVIRTWVATGNPVFPFADGVFHSPHWSEDRAEMYQGAQQAFGRAFRFTDQGLAETEPTSTSHRALGRLISVPWHLTFHPDWFFDRGLNYDGKAATGPLWLAMLPVWLLALLAIRQWPSATSYHETRDETVRQVYKPEFGREVPVAETREIVEHVTIPPGRPLRIVLAHLLLIGLLWFYSMQYGRYLVPHLALWSIGIAWAADGLLRLRLSAVAVTLAIALQLAGGLSYGLAGSYRALQVAAGGLTRDQFVQGALPAYGAMQWINETTNASDVIALYGEPRGYWLDRPYLWAERGHSTVIPDSVRSDSSTYLNYLRDELGVRYALIYEPVFPTDRTTGDDDVALVGQGIADGQLQEVYRDDARHVAVYRWE